MAAESKRQNAGNKAPVALPNSGPPPPSPTVALETALGGVMGARVRVTTSPPTSSTYEGLLYTADPITNLIVLSIPSPSSPSNPVSNSSTSAANPAPTTTNTFKILPIPFLTSFTILSLPSTTSSVSASASPSSVDLPHPTALDIPSLHSRASTTISAIKCLDAKRGRGVTREAQEIFDGIARTYPARWLGTSMVVNENVVIEQPYHVEDCRLLVAAPSATDGVEKGGERGGAGGGGAGEKAGFGGIGGGSAGGSTEQGLLRIKKVLGMEREKLALRRGLGPCGLGGSPAAKRGGGGAAAAVGLVERKGG